MLPILFISVSIKSKFCPVIFYNTALFYASCQRKENISFSSHEGSSFFSFDGYLLLVFFLSLGVWAWLGNCCCCEPVKPIETFYVILGLYK